MPELVYNGSIQHGHVVYGPVTLKPYRVHPGEPVEVDARDAAALKETQYWTEYRGTSKPAGKPDPEKDKTRRTDE